MDVIGPVPEEMVDTLRTLVQHHRTLEDVTRWALFCKPPKIIERVVEQDEYTLDVVLRFSDDVYLVYDTT